MPYIKRKSDKSNKDNTQYKKRQKVYQNPIWKKMRLAKLMENPLCFACECEGKITLAQDLHHLRSFSNQHNENETNALAFDSNNIVPLCKFHHWAIHHGELKGATTLDEIKSLLNNKNKQSNENEL